MECLRQKPTRHAFTLAETLVSIAIIAILIGILLPAVQAVRESSRQMSCGNNVRQIGIAMHHHHAALNRLPSGSIAKQYNDAPHTPWTFYRWSAFALLSPYLENTAAYEVLDLSKPLYNASLGITAENLEGSKAIVQTFLCPSDDARRLHPSFGPTNYAVCTGTGINGGTPIDTDGMFYVNSNVELTEVLDGTSNTIALSESILGGSGLSERDPQTSYRFWIVSPLTDAICNVAPSWNYQDPRGFAWVSGEYRSALYNHYLPPNSKRHDCIGTRTFGGQSTVFTPFGWRTARSRHRSGINALRGDGSLTFVSDSIEHEIWRAIATRAGRERGE